jgi:Recombinase
MTTNTNQSGVPRWAATAGRRSLAQRVAAHGARLFGSSKPQPTDRDDCPAARSSDLPWSVRQRVLREYHTATLAQARFGSEEMVRAGFNIGAIPYGYRPQRIRIASVTQRARWRTRLVLEPVEAATVKMIFTWRGEDGLTIAGIHQRLISARYPTPLDPETGQPSGWSDPIIRAILRNPKYLGRQVWGRRRHGRSAPTDEWVWSPVWAHPPIISTDEFVAANSHSRLAAALPGADGPVAEATDQTVA